MFVRAKYHTTEEWVDQDDHEFSPEQNYFVGGNTKLYGAALFRLRPEDFGVIQHHGGLSPAWPLSYEDFEPYYGQAESLYHVHGESGEDPTDGPRSTPYPYPPIQHEPRIQKLHEDLLKLGLHPAHLPLGVLLDQDEHGNATHASACIRCNRVDGFPCLVNGKADSQVVCVDPALAEHPNLTLLTDAHVTRLETDVDGREITAVHAEMADGSERRVSGDVVVVACGALELGPLVAPLGERHPFEGSGQRVRPGGSQLHPPQQPGGDRALPDSQRHQTPEDIGHERLVPQGRGLGLPVGQHPDAGKVRR